MSRTVESLSRRETRMEEFIARENIRRFEVQLKISTDETQLSEIRALLAAERHHLHKILNAEPLQPR